MNDIVEDFDYWDEIDYCFLSLSDAIEKLNFYKIDINNQNMVEAVKEFLATHNFYDISKSKLQY